MAQTPANDEVIAALDAAIQSLSQQPNQFHLSVSATGVSAVSQGGGTGLSVNVQGGGAGSQTTGMVVRADTGAITIATQTADAAMTEQAAKAVSLLTDIKQQLQSATPDKVAVKSKLAQFSETYVAPVVQAVVTALITKRLGL